MKGQWDVYKCDCGRKYAIEQILGDELEEPACPECGETNSQLTHYAKERNGRMNPEFAIYKGDDLLVMGTAEACAEKMGVSKEYIYWLTMPTAKRRLAGRKRPERCTVGIRLDAEDDEG